LIVFLRILGSARVKTVHKMLLVKLITGEPNGGKHENCGEIRNGGWNDYDCQDKRPFICKVKGKESFTINQGDS